MASLQLYTDTSTNKVTTVDIVAALTTAIIISISLMRIMPCSHAQLPTLPLTKDQIITEGPTYMYQALSPLQI